MWHRTWHKGSVQKIEAVVFGIYIDQSQWWVPTQMCQPRTSVALSLLRCKILTGNFHKVAVNWFVYMSVKGLVLRQGA